MASAVPARNNLPYLFTLPLASAARATSRFYRSLLSSHFSIPNSTLPRPPTEVALPPVCASTSGLYMPTIPRDPLYNVIGDSHREGTPQTCSLPENSLSPISELRRGATRSFSPPTSRPLAVLLLAGILVICLLISYLLRLSNSQVGLSHLMNAMESSVSTFYFSWPLISLVPQGSGS